MSEYEKRRKEARVKVGIEAKEKEMKKVLLEFETEITRMQRQIVKELYGIEEGNVCALPGGKTGVYMKGESAEECDCLRFLLIKKDGLQGMQIAKVSGELAAEIEKRFDTYEDYREAVL